MFISVKTPLACKFEHIFTMHMSTLTTHFHYALYNMCIWEILGD
jgi:hypothetical protein